MIVFRDRIAKCYTIRPLLSLRYHWFFTY